MKRYVKIFLGVWMTALVGLSCQLPFSGPQADTPTPQVVTVVVTSAPQEVTSTAGIPITATTGPAQPTPTSGPQCTIQKQVNFRTGPGTDFVPPLRSLDAGVQVIPQGFVAQGFPTGSWVQVLEPQANEIGWVNADAQFIACNVDVTKLPSVSVQAPPPPPPPRVSNSQPDGDPNGLIAKVILSPSYLMSFQVYTGDGSKDGDGMKRVTFTIQRDGKKVYERTEGTAHYCIFGGGEPDCNPWPMKGRVFTWGEGGPAVESGVYNVQIVAEPTYANGDDSQFGSWHFDLTVDLNQ
jgi:hypothetical protein